MKKFILSIIATVFMFIGVSTTANAQAYADPVQAFDNCRMYVQQANDQYNAGQFVDARASYSRALECNASCPGKKFMSDSKLSKKIRNCDYAIAHGGVTREQKSKETWETIGAVLAVGAVTTAAVAEVASDHPCPPHHDYHPSHHPDYHRDYVEVHHYSHY